MTRLNRIRAFMGFKLPDEIISSINKIRESPEADQLKIRWVRPENIHLTLKFFGDIIIEDIERIDRAIADAASRYAPISVFAKGIGVFPDMRRPRVVWTGIGGETDQVINFQKAIDKNLRQIGFPEEKRRFSGHLTLGRVKGKIDLQALSDILNRFKQFETNPFILDRIILFQSELKPSGPEYIRLASAELNLMAS